MLIVLLYSSNSCYTNVKELSKTPEVEVSGDNWIFENKQYKIGQSRRCGWGCRYGPIIVVESTKIEHLNLLVNASHEAVREPSSFKDD